MNDSNRLTTAENLVDSKLDWSQPSLKRLSLKDAETANITLSSFDGASSYS